MQNRTESNKDTPLTPLQILTAPLTPDEIEWKIQSSKNNKTLVVPYVHNRTIMDRFNAAFGWDGWENEFLPFDGGFICTITVTLPDGRKLRKADGAGRTAIEPVKGGISDSMKRCAVQFGLGRSLYEYPKVYLEGEQKFIPNWGLTLLDRLVKGFNAGPLGRDVFIMKEADAQKPARQYDPGR